MVRDRKWRKQAEKKEPQCLVYEREIWCSIMLNQVTVRVTLINCWSTRVPLPLEYLFLKPGKQHDRYYPRPIPFFPAQSKVIRTLWVFGYRACSVTVVFSLLKSLPKSLRRHLFCPVENADRCWKHSHLWAALLACFKVKQLRKRTGVGDQAWWLAFGWSAAVFENEFQAGGWTGKNYWPESPRWFKTQLKAGLVKKSRRQFPGSATGFLTNKTGLTNWGWLLLSYRHAAKRTGNEPPPLLWWLVLIMLGSDFNWILLQTGKNLLGFRA